jgi:bZIP transcription factor
MSALDSGAQPNSGEVMDWLTTNLESVLNGPLPQMFNASTANDFGAESRLWHEFSPRSISRARKEAGQSANAMASGNKAGAQYSQQEMLFPSVAEFGRAQQGFPFRAGYQSSTTSNGLFTQHGNHANTSAPTLEKECPLTDGMTTASIPVHSPFRIETKNALAVVSRPTGNVPKAKRSRGAPKKHIKTASSPDNSETTKAVTPASGLASSNTGISAEERRRIRAARNRESAEKSRLRRKQYTDDLEREVGSLRETNKMLKGRAMLLTMTLQKADAEVSSAIAKGSVLSSQPPLNGSALKSALMALGNARMQCPVTFGDSSDRSDIARTNGSQ